MKGPNVRESSNYPSSSARVRGRIGWELTYIVQGSGCLDGKSGMIHLGFIVGAVVEPGDNVVQTSTTL